MLLTNEQMLNSLIFLSQADNEKGMLGYAIARNKQKIMDEVQEYSAKRDELLKEFGKDMGDGKFQLMSENAAKFYEALKPYSELTVDIQVMQIAPEVFYGGNLTSAAMFALAWMVKE